MLNVVRNCKSIKVRWSLIYEVQPQIQVWHSVGWSSTLILNFNHASAEVQPQIQVCHTHLLKLSLKFKFDSASAEAQPQIQVFHTRRLKLSLKFKFVTRISWSSASNESSTTSKDGLTIKNLVYSRATIFSHIKWTCFCRLSCVSFINK